MSGPHREDFSIRSITHLGCNRGDGGVYGHALFVPPAHCHLRDATWDAPLHPPTEQVRGVSTRPCNRIDEATENSGPE